ncbi:MAG: hypothetical protein E6J85_21465 [Deltaproteobacteria bacterium]|nr:MAG: hypothetical protein E6J85_21465 [Deltaproteobacteria bacterium]
MKLRTVIIGVAVASATGYVIYDSNSPESRRARELHDIEKLKPDIKIADCYPQGPLAKAFAAAVANDTPSSPIENEVTRRSVIKHDCIRGSPNHATVDKLVATSGDEMIPYPCLALDGLAAQGSPTATAALDKIATERKTAKEVWEGALYRAIQKPDYKTPAQLAAMLADDKEWEAKELLLEKIREKHDPAARDPLTRAYAKEDDETTKGHVRAALLELDNPGRCVVEDEGRGADGICRYTCRETGTRVRFQKLGKECPLVREPEKAPEKPAVDAASLAGKSK